MEVYYVQIIETIVVLIGTALVQLFTKKAIDKTLKRFQFAYQRRKVTVKVINLFAMIAAVVFIAGIWGVDHSELVLFVSSLLTILGIAFFAQWSILSNVTAGVISFFNHPIKLGDKIKIMDKDYPIEGTIEDISFYFIHIKTLNNQQITVPNTIVLQKALVLEPMNEL